MQTAILILVTAAFLQSALAANDDIPACRNLTYCTVKPPNYPQEKFTAMFKNIRVLAEPSPVRNLVSFDNRQGDPSEKDNCESVVKIDPVYQVRESLEKPWRNVIQVPNVDYVQSVRLETCSSPGAKCFTVFQELSEFVTFCKQKYLHYDFLVEKSTDSTETETIRAELPVCCSCHYKSAT